MHQFPSFLFIGWRCSLRSPCVCCSSVMYFVEHGSWDEASQSYLRSDGKATPFISIPHTFYWCIVTMVRPVS